MRTLRRLSVLLLLGTLVAGSSATATPVSSQSPWLSYHGGANGAASALAVTAVDTSAPAWTSPQLDGSIYTEPLIDGQLVYVATENDSIYALNASTGAVQWRTSVGEAVPASSLPCGDIAPSVGITGTPVIDQFRHELFAVAEVLRNGAVQHELVGLSTLTGAIEMRQVIDLPGMVPQNYLQRTGLALDGGRVYFGVAGNDGDCAFYRGRLFSVAERGGSVRSFTIDSAGGQYQGGIWMGGAAPDVDATGDLWVSVGNGSVRTTGQPYDHSDAVLKFSPALKLLSFFTPSNWAEQNAQDLDISATPAFLTNGLVVVAGKAPTLYVESSNHLSGVGHPLAQATRSCPSDIDGGPVVSGDVAILPCLSGPEAVRAVVTPTGGVTITNLWQATAGGGPPLLTRSRVWTIGRDGVLYGLSLTTGAVVQSVTIGAVANHFTTPSIGDGELVVANANAVLAFRATS